MKKKNFSIFLIVFFTGFIIGDLESKKIINYFKNLKNDKINIDNTIKKEPLLINQKIIKANSYDLLVENFINIEIFTEDLPEYVLRTAGFQIKKVEEEYDYRVFLQDGSLITSNSKSKLNLPNSIDYELNGGLKSVFTFNRKDYGVISNKKLGCSYISLVDLSNNNILLESECLPYDGDPDFNGSGGAYIFFKDNLYLSIGTPSWMDGEKINMLAQDDSSIFGKILKISLSGLSLSENYNLTYQIFSKGHRNPQGLVEFENKLFSTEHGPQGGDELNIVIENQNYGWPIKSFGTRYGDGESYKDQKSGLNLVDPIYSFIPAVAPSSLGICPQNLANYYSDNTCLLSLSLRDNSIFVILLNKLNNTVQSIEKINLNKRMRHFGTNVEGKVFFDDNFFFITTDTLEILKIKFLNFR